MTKKYEYEIPKYFSGGFFISKYHSEERIIQDLKNKMGACGYVFDGDFLPLGSTRINIRNVKYWDKDHVITDSIILKKTDTTFKKIGTTAYENNGTKLIISLYVHSHRLDKRIKLIDQYKYREIYCDPEILAIIQDRIGEGNTGEKRMTWKNNITWENSREIVIKKWKRRALAALQEQLADGCFDEDNFNDLVSYLISYSKILESCRKGEHF
jgi:hypothetical protein